MTLGNETASPVDRPQATVNPALPSSADAALAPWDGRDAAASVLVSLLVFGPLAVVLSTRFWLDLGLLFTVSNERLIDVLLRRLGIRLVPDTFGASFVSAFMFMTGAWILLGTWKAAAPAWASPFSPPSWGLVAGAAALMAALASLSTRVARTVFQRAGLTIARDSVTWTLVRGVAGFALLGGLLLVLSAPAVSDWLARHVALPLS